MLRRQFLASCSAALVASSAGHAQAAPAQPNILFIMSDDHAAHAISAYGSKINKTPNIDRLAAEGMRLQNCFVTNSICTPSRACILTGQYSHQNGVKTLNDAMDTKKIHVAHLLQKAGYQTAMIGKWHLASEPQGFAHWQILPGQGLYHDPIFLTSKGRTKHTGYCTDLITTFTLDYLRGRDKSKPFFVMCHHKAPHRAWESGPKYAEMLKDTTVPEPDNLYDDYAGRAEAVKRAKMRVGEDMTPTDVKRPLPADLKGNALRKWAYQHYIKDYLRCVQSVDDSVGDILDFLDKEGLKENTLVIYTSDQGFFLGDHGWFDKRYMYEESLRMPFLARWPKRIPAGSTSAALVTNVDFAPLFLEAAGQAKDAAMQGESCLPVLQGKTPKKWRKSMYYRYWMHMDSSHDAAAQYGVRTDRYKLICYYGKALGSKGAKDITFPVEWELFDLKSDPREMKNVYADPGYAKVRKQLEVELARLQKQYQDIA